MAEVSPANINETSNSNTDESKLANDNADSNQLTNEIAVNNDDNSQDGDSEWKIMTAEEEERERSLDEEVEIKKQLIEKVLEEHETWRLVVAIIEYIHYTSTIY